MSGTVQDIKDGEATKMKIPRRTKSTILDILVHLPSVASTSNSINFHQIQDVIKSSFHKHHLYHLIFLVLPIGPYIPS